jgi:hypothetical protein
MDSACCCGPVAGREERDTVAVGIAEVAGRRGQGTAAAGVAQEIEVMFHIIADGQRSCAGRTDGREERLGLHHFRYSQEKRMTGCQPTAVLYIN